LRQDEIGGGHRGHFYLEVDPVEHRARDAGLVALGASPTLTAGKAGLAGMAAMILCFE
jgi:hypothetical protein